MAENGFHVHPLCFFSPSSLFLFQLFYSRLVRADGVHLGSKHHRREDEEKQPLEAQQDEEDDGGGGREGAALCPIFFKAVQEVESHHDEGVQGDESYVHCKQDKIFLVVLPNTVVDPGTVVVHLPDAALTDTAVVRSVGLDAAAFRTLVHHLPRLQL